jgi:hypothetical protein
MRKILRKIDRRFQLSRPNFRKPGSVLILVVALLVLMALIGTAFLSTQRGDRYNSIQHTNNTEIDLLLEGVKNMAKATIVGSLNDPSLPFPYRPANSTIAKNWDAYDLYHQYTTDPLITRTPNRRLRPASPGGRSPGQPAGRPGVVVHRTTSHREHLRITICSPGLRLRRIARQYSVDLHRSHDRGFCPAHDDNANSDGQHSLPILRHDSLPGWHVSDFPRVPYQGQWNLLHLSRRRRGWGWYG